MHGADYIQGRSMNKSSEAPMRDSATEQANSPQAALQVEGLPKSVCCTGQCASQRGT